MKKSILIITVLLMSCLTSFAQYEHIGFRGVQRRLDWWLAGSAGTTVSLAENAASNNFVKNFPAVDFQIGTYFTRTFGMRMVGGFTPQTGQAPDELIQLYPEKYDTYYRFYMLSLSADAVINLTSLFKYYRNHRSYFGIMLFAGPGMVEALHFDMKLKDWNDYPVDYQDKTCWTGRVGLLATVRMSSHWDWMLEGSYNMIENRYDGVEEKSAPSGFVKLQTGVVYHIHDRSSRMIRLSTANDMDWAPRYTDKEREKVRQEERERIEKARKETAKRRADKNKEIKKHNEEVKKKNEELRKAKKKREDKWEEAKLYNEFSF